MVLQDLVELRHRTGFHPFQAVVQSNPAARDGSGSRAAVRLDDVAVDGNLLFPKRAQVHHGAKRAADQALDFLGAPALLAGRSFALHPITGRARQHAVFGRHPALAAVAKPCRRLLLKARGAEDVGVAEADEAGPFRMFREVALEGNLAHLVGFSA